MANTPFLDLVKPAGTDKALVSVINSNSDKIDGGYGTLSEQIGPYGESQWVGNVTSIDALDSLITPGRYLRYLNIANVGLPGGWAVIDVSALKGYDNYIQVVTYPTTGESYTRHHPTNGTWGNFNSLVNKIGNGLYEYTITGTTTATGAINTGLYNSSYTIVNAYMPSDTDGNYVVLPIVVGGNALWVVVKKYSDMTPYANQSVTIKVRTWRVTPTQGN